MRIIIESWLKGVSVLEHIKGYGGIERVVSTMTREFIKQGHKVTLIAPEGSFIEGAKVIETDDFNVAYKYIIGSDFDIVWDHSCWSIDSPVRKLESLPFVSTTHVNHAIGWAKNVVYLSDSQRISHERQLNRNLDYSPVIRVPTDPNLIPKGLKKLDYLLFIGLVAEHKGVLEAAELAKKLKRRFVVAGPAWGEYADKVLDMDNVQYIGIVDGDFKNDLIEQAYAICCLSCPGQIEWLEPGCGVVGEAFAFNTPVIAFNNGCLPEIVETGINGWVGTNINELYNLINSMPDIRPTRQWDAANIASEYIELFEEVMKGDTWG